MYFQLQAIRRRSLVGLFVNARQAFYAIIRQLALNIPVLRDELAWLMKTSKLPPEATLGLEKKLTDAPLATRGVDQRLSTVTSEAYAETWFAIEELTNICDTHKRTKAGEPLADIIFGFSCAELFLTPIDARAMKDWWSRRHGREMCHC
jgi:hypothetical protein